jgi:hypothetical protein
MPSDQKLTWIATPSTTNPAAILVGLAREPLGLANLDSHPVLQTTVLLTQALS